MSEKRTQLFEAWKKCQKIQLDYLNEHLGIFYPDVVEMCRRAFESGLDICTCTECIMNKVAHAIDLAVLDPRSQTKDVIKACNLAKKYKMASVCVYPIDVLFTKMLLRESDVKVSTVIGFPFGNQLTDIKCEEAKRAIADGAEELDMVMSMGRFIDAPGLGILLDIQRVVHTAGGIPVKVIIETGNWSSCGIIKASKMVEEAGGAFVKTCTGFGPRGVEVEDIELIKEAVKLPIKASGGIKTRQQAEFYLEQGCSRLGIGLSSIEKILK